MVDIPSNQSHNFCLIDAWLNTPAAQLTDKVPLIDRIENQTF